MRIIAMPDTYASIDTPLSDVLHGAARVHVALGKMDGEEITTRGWQYNELVDNIISLSTESLPPDVRQGQCLETLFDTLDAVIEIRSDAVKYLMSLNRLGCIEGRNDNDLLL